MKKNIVVFFFLINGIISAQYNFDFSKLSISESKVDTINYYYNKMIKSNGIEKKKIERLFFLSLPNNHREMLDAMHIHSSKQLLEYEKHKDDENYLPKFSVINEWVKYLSTMSYDNSKEYYEKYFNICIGGEYGADYMRSGFEIYKRFLIDTQIACSEMSKLKDEQIESIFYFIFDESHPSHNDESIALYNYLYLRVEQYDKRLSELLKKAYKKIIEERKHH